MREPVTAHIALGANLGDAAATLLQAMHDIADIDGVVLVRQSSLYASAPVDSSGPDYVNAVVQVRTLLKPQRLLDQLQALEVKAGRQRTYRNAPRTLDLDILLFGDERIESATLTLPHPRMWGRAFVLRPLAEVAPGLVTGSQLQAVADQAVWVHVLPVA